MLPGCALFFAPAGYLLRCASCLFLHSQAHHRAARCRLRWDGCLRSPIDCRVCADPSVVERDKRATCTVLASIAPACAGDRAVLGGVCLVVVPAVSWWIGRQWVMRPLWSVVWSGGIRLACRRLASVLWLHRWTVLCAV